MRFGAPGLTEEGVDSSHKNNLSLLSIVVVFPHPLSTPLHVIYMEHFFFFNLVHEDLTSLFRRVSAAALEFTGGNVELSRFVLTICL